MKPAPSERRVVTVLAVDIAQSTRHIAEAEPEDAQAFFDRCFDYLRRAIERTGGRLASYEGDGGVAIFGWPRASEDHAERALVAAWDIQHGEGETAPDGRRTRFRVGVHSGLAAVREFTRGDRSRFNAVGVTVHLAAKLQQLAQPGEVLASEQTVRLCRTAPPATPVGASRSLFDLSLAAYRLDGAPERPSESEFLTRYRAPILGRDAELATLRRLGPSSRRAAIVALIGEPGIGKSRLAAAALQEAHAAGAEVAVFFGDAQKRSTPFAAPRAVIRQILARRSDGVPLSDLIAQAASGREEAEALGALLDDRPGAGRSRGGQITLARLAGALARLFMSLVGDGMVVLIEDLHLVDAESRRFLVDVARRLEHQPVTLLMTGRPEARRDAASITDLVLHLEPLPTEAMAELARRLWPDRLAGGGLRRKLIARADGVPFVLEELVRSLELASPDEGVPQSVSSVIHARIQSLSPRARSLSQALSLLGEHVDMDLAAAVTETSGEALKAAFAELERVGLIHPIRGRTTHMRHQILAEACAETIPRERRRDLHAKALAAIRQLHADLNGRHEQLAFHAEGAGALDVAVDCLWNAALEARRSAAAASLNAIFDRAVRILEQIGDDAGRAYVDLVLMANAALVQLGEFEKVNRHLPRAMELARASGRPELVCSALSQLGMICWFEGRYAEGLRATEEGLALARELCSPALIFANTIMLTNILHDMGDADRAVAEQRRLCDMLKGDLATARLGAPGGPRVTALAFMSWYLVDTGLFDEALAIARQALAEAAAAEDAYGEILARNALGRALTLVQQDAEAAECLTRALEICGRDGYDAIHAHLSGRLATALARTGRPEDGVRIAEDCLAQGFDRRTGRLENFCLRIGYAESLVGAGASSRGLAELDAALALAREIDSPGMQIEALGLRARLIAQLRPEDPQSLMDRMAQAELRRRHGLAPPPSDAGAETVGAGPG